MSKANYESEWVDRRNAAIHKLLPVGATLTDEAERDAIYEILPGYLLFCFCESYRQEFATQWQAFEGFTPAQLYLIEKHHWLPEQALGLKESDLLLLLHRELLAIRAPQQARKTIQDDFARLGVLLSNLKIAEDPSDT